MYKQLMIELKKYKIQKQELQKLLEYGNQKAISIRLNGKTKFQPDEEDTIFNYLKKKGYSGSKKRLMAYSDPEQKIKPENRLSRLIKQRMNSLNYTNKDIVEMINKKGKSDGISVSENTVYLWRSGKVNAVRTEYIDLLSQILDVSPYYLLGDDRYKNDGYNKILSDTKKKYDDDLDLILSSLLNYFITVDDRYSIFNDNKEMKRFIDANREEIYHNLLPTIKKYFDEEYFNNYDPINNDKSRIFRSRIPKNKKDTYNQNVEYVRIVPDDRTDDESQTTYEIPIKTAKKLADNGQLDFSKKELIEDQGKLYYKIISPQFFIDNKIKIDAPKKSKKGK